MNNERYTGAGNLGRILSEAAERIPPRIIPMTIPSTTSPAEDAAKLIARIDAAIQRIVDGNAAMRIPADLTDPDLVLADCKRALLASRAPAEVPASLLERVRECLISERATGMPLLSLIREPLLADIDAALAASPAPSAAPQTPPLASTQTACIGTPGMPYNIQPWPPGASMLQVAVAPHAAPTLGPTAMRPATAEEAAAINARFSGPSAVVPTPLMLGKDADSLHQQIMNLPRKSLEDDADGFGPHPMYRKGYLEGHRDARHAAAELVAASASPGAPSAPTPATFGWLIENGKQAGAGLAYRFIDNDAGGVPDWTPDNDKALRFARREDAEQFAQQDEDAGRIVEHGWEACWCRKCNPGVVRMFVCPDCHCKRCPKAADHAAATGCMGNTGVDVPGGHTCSGCEENRRSLAALSTAPEAPKE